MPNTDVIKNNVLLAQHHVEDAEESDSEDVVESSLEDIDESLTRIKDTLPNKATMTIQEKIAAAETRDAAVAFQYGFAKAAAYAGLTRNEVAQVYDVGVKLAAAEEQLKVSTEEAAIKPKKQPTEEKRKTQESKPNVAGAVATTNEDTKHTVTLPAAIKQAMAKRAMAAGDFDGRNGEKPYVGGFADEMAKANKPAPAPAAPKPAVGKAPKVTTKAGK
jgi:hypothetical protein